MLKNASVICSLLFLVCGCGPRKYIKTKPLSEIDEPLPTLSNFSAASPRITLMTWNLENLFDTVDDPKTDDDAFLPAATKALLLHHEKKCKKKKNYSWVKQCLEWDWNEDVLKIKLERLAQVIRSVNHGLGPDILVVQEVENFQVLDRLAQEYLGGLGYTTYLIENHDFRGIDVGIITRLRPRETPSLAKLRARPALTMSLEMGGGDILHLTGVHFPIAPTPIEKRLELLKTMGADVDENSHEFMIAAGDFNFHVRDQIEHRIIKNYVRSHWIPAQLYCRDCLGTFFDSYEGEWSFLDMILVSPRFFAAKTTWTIDPASVHVHNSLEMQTALDGSPADFEVTDRSGVSDHWPLVIQLVKTDSH